MQWNVCLALGAGERGYFLSLECSLAPACDVVSTIGLHGLCLVVFPPSAREPDPSDSLLRVLGHRQNWKLFAFLQIPADSGQISESAQQVKREQEVCLDPLLSTSVGLLKE